MTDPDTEATRIEPLLNVSDIRASVRFYVDGLGFRIVNRWEVSGELRWARMEYGDAALMIQQLPTQGADAWRPVGAVGQGITLCLMCTDARRVYHSVIDRGLQPRPPYVGNGLWVTSLTDPDGYRLDFESPADSTTSST